jgi:hypothetical protein
VYGECATNEGNVRKWHLFLKEGGTKLSDKVQGGLPSLVTNNFKGAKHKKLANVKKQFNLCGWSEKFSASTIDVDIIGIFM